MMKDGRTMLLTSMLATRYHYIEVSKMSGTQSKFYNNHPLALYYTILTFNNPQQRSLSKKLWEKEKMLVTSIFAFSHKIFYSSQNRFQIFSQVYFVVCTFFKFGKELTLYNASGGLTTLKKEHHKNIVGKRKMSGTRIFSFSDCFVLFPK